MVADDRVLEERYFERMAESLGDKKRLLQYLPTGGSVLDVGAGGGDLSNALSLMGWQVTALDGNSDAIKRIEALNPDVRTVHGMTDDIPSLLIADKFDAIICSAVLHEVFSYSNDGGRFGSYPAVKECLRNLFDLLNPDGVLIIRDGVKPVDADKVCSFRFKEGFLESGLEALKLYNTLSPFIGQTSTLSELVIEGEVVSGTVREVMEFLYTYTWGKETFHREALELYGVFSWAEYAEQLSNAGFGTVHGFEYVQPGYAEFLGRKVELLGHDWFSTNAIWVARKLGPKKNFRGRV